MVNFLAGGTLISAQLFCNYMSDYIIFFQVFDPSAKHSSAQGRRQHWIVSCFASSKKLANLSIMLIIPLSVMARRIVNYNEINNDDGNSLEFLKDDRYTFYQIPGASHEPENTQKTENATEQVYIYLPLPTSKFQSRSRAIFYPTMGTTSLIYLVIPCFYQFITPSIRSLEHHLNQKTHRQ